MEYGVLFLILIQLISAFLVYTQRSETTAVKLSISLTLTNFFLSALLLITGSFGSFKFFGVLEFLPDRLGLLLATYILLVSSVVHKYAENYMKDDEGYRRFYFLLDLMTANLILLVISGNLLLLFLSWHTMGFLLTLMLNHNYANPQAVKFANLSFIIHRLADVPLLISIVLLFKEYGTLSIPELEKIILSNQDYSFTLWIVPLLVVISAMIKSAQIPFHLWLVYSMEGPTPVSALMHAGIVNAGAFLVNRLAFTFTHENIALHLSFFVGSLTAILGSALMLLQNDVKKALGYSTVGQMGYMVMEFGIGAFALAVYHMMAHGIFKATLFLYSGNVIHNARKDPNIPEDEVYSFITKGKQVAKRVPLIAYIFFTVVIPLLIVILVHLIVEKHFLKYETQLIILIFAWATAAQAVVSTFRAWRERPLFSFLLSVLSLLTFLLIYVVMGHSLNNFLYPNQTLIERIYEKSFSNPVLLFGEMILIGLIIVAGWILIYFANKEKFLTINLFLYTQLSRELYFMDLYEFIKDIFIRLSNVLRNHYVIILLSLVLLLYMASEMSTEEALVTLLSGFLIPLLPVGYVTVQFLKGKDYFWYALFPLLGILVIDTYTVPSEVKAVGLTTFFFFTIRLLTSRNLVDFTAELFGALLSLVWILEGNYIYIPALMLSPILFVFLRDYLRKYYGTTEFGFVKGLMKNSPKLSALVILLITYSYGMPLLLTFGAIYEGVYLYTEMSFLFLILWIILSSALFWKIGKNLFFKPSDFLYFDVGDKIFRLGILLWIVSFTLGLIIPYGG
ncbi:proton-conducting transporter transmembrane domain-containing protein [Aquifex sp.]